MVVRFELDHSLKGNIAQAVAAMRSAIARLNSLRGGRTTQSDLLAGLLQDTIAWTQRTEVWAYDRSIRRGGAEFITASFTPGSPAYRQSLYYAVRDVLEELLPNPTFLRIMMTLALITPIIVSGHSTGVKQAKIRNVLPKLRPRGDNDYQDGLRDQAAGRLAILVI
jgi:hypothetical protein